MRKLVVVVFALLTSGVYAQQADLSVLKTASPALPTAGETLTYAITFRNDGPDSAQQIVVIDMIPENTTFVSYNDFIFRDTFCVGPPLSGINGLRCGMASLGAGQSRTVTLTVRVNLDAVGATISNTVTISSSTPDPNPSGNSFTLLTPVSPIPPSQADLSIVKRHQGDPFVGRGQVATFEIVVSNAGPIPASNVTLTDVVPAQTTFESITAPAGFTCTTPAAGATGTITCTAATMAQHTSATFLLSVRLTNTATGTITNTASVSSSTPDPDSNDLSSSAGVTATDPGADLQVTKTANPPGTVNAGDHISYTIEVRNIGSDAAGNVRVIDFTPANTTFVGISGGSGTGSPFCAPPQVTSSGAAECSMGTISPQDAKVVFMTVRVNPNASGQIITNTASITTGTPDPNPANNTGTAQNQVSGTPPTTADYSVVKTPANAFAGPGENETFTIQVSNNGPLAAQNFTITDVIPSQMTFQSITAPAGFTCSTPAVGANGTITCTNPSFADQAVATFTVVLRANQVAPTTFTNTATVSADTPDSNPQNNSSSTSVTITETTGPDVRLTKSASPAVASPGQTITYTIVATNIGSAGASRINITDPIPAGTTFVSVVEPGGTGSNCFEPHFANQFVTCDFPFLGPTGSLTMTFTVRVNPGTTGSITNTANVTTTFTTDPVLSNNTATAGTIVTGGGAHVAIPLLDPRALLLLVIVLAAAGALVLK